MIIYLLIPIGEMTLEMQNRLLISNLEQTRQVTIAGTVYYAVDIPRTEIIQTPLFDSYPWRSRTEMQAYLLDNGVQ